ncbi:hypothetical protein CEUSTIGMA_g11017.t1 [Chlamydomonas eustigma]|uniref:Uncharacterized protein n=1 Tax=Chlamydomonas eustigma TaxID=1157962 RepID=A0A250XL23_9CHLO|nr:hypothetical protein CEUSTIGMA_g11017.t1 [Chlamydomonas eustigma]|eukprot:GAX83592.1 hypothetical protein CEUSTIGMA_g11017.t1 [Chlamydomonas eustigma]
MVQTFYLKARLDGDSSEQAVNVPIIRTTSSRKKVLHADTAGAADCSAKAIIFSTTDKISQVRDGISKLLGKDPHAWALTGEKRVEMVEKDDLRYITIHTTLAGTESNLFIEELYFDPRLSFPPGTAEAHSMQTSHVFSQKLRALVSNEDWIEAMDCMPLDAVKRREVMVSFLKAKMASMGDVDLMAEGCTGLWEMTLNREHHAQITPECVAQVLSMLEVSDIRVLLPASATIWALSTNSASRRKLLDHNAIPSLLSCISRAQQMSPFSISEGSAALMKEALSRDKGLVALKRRVSLDKPVPLSPLGRKLSGLSPNSGNGEKQQSIKLQRSLTLSSVLEGRAATGDMIEGSVTAADDYPPPFQLLRFPSKGTTIVAGQEPILDRDFDHGSMVAGIHSAVDKERAFQHQLLRNLLRNLFGTVAMLSVDRPCRQALMQQDSAFKTLLTATSHTHIPPPPASNATGRSVYLRSAGGASGQLPPPSRLSSGLFTSTRNCSAAAAPVSDAFNSGQMGSKLGSALLAGASVPGGPLLVGPPSRIGAPAAAAAAAPGDFDAAGGHVGATLGSNSLVTSDALLPVSETDSLVDEDLSALYQNAETIAVRRLEAIRALTSFLQRDGEARIAVVNAGGLNLIISLLEPKDPAGESVQFCASLSMAAITGDEAAMKLIMQRGEGLALLNAATGLLKDTMRRISDELSTRVNRESPPPPSPHSPTRGSRAEREITLVSPATSKPAEPISMKNNKAVKGQASATASYVEKASESRVETSYPWPDSQSHKEKLTSLLQLAVSSTNSIQNICSACPTASPMPLLVEHLEVIAEAARQCWQIAGTPPGSGQNTLEPLGEASRNLATALAYLAATSSETADMLMSVPEDLVVRVLVELSLVVETEAFKRAGEVKASACSGLAFLTCYPLGAKGEACMHGPYRRKLLELGAFGALLRADLVSLRNPPCDAMVHEACAVGLMYLCTEAGDMAPAELSMFATLMAEEESSSATAYIVAGFWILLRSEYNRKVMFNGYHSDPALVVAQAHAEYLRGVFGKQAIHASSPTITKKRGISRLTSSSTSPFSTHHTLKDVVENEERDTLTTLLGRMPTLPLSAYTDPMTKKGFIRGLSSETSLDAEFKPGAMSPRDLAQAEAELLVTRFDGALERNWGLVALVDVGGAWLPNLRSQDQSGVVKDAMVLKFFEFMTSALCLLLLDHDVSGVSNERRELDFYLLGAPPGVQSQSWWTMDAPAPKQPVEVEEGHRRALLMLVELIGIQKLLSCWKIVQLSLLTLWNLCSWHHGFERVAVEGGAPGQVLGAAYNDDWPISLRDMAGGCLGFFTERFSNMAHFPAVHLPSEIKWPLKNPPTEGLVPTIACYISLINSRLPLLELRGCLGIARIAYSAPYGATEWRRYITEAKAVATALDGIKSLLRLLKRLNRRYQDLVNGYGHAKEQLRGSYSDSEVSDAFFHIQQAATSDGGSSMVWQEAAAFQRNMTVIESSTETKNNSAGAAQPMMYVVPAGEADRKLLHLCSCVIQNMSLHPENRTPLYKAELEGATLMGRCLDKAEQVAILAKNFYNVHQDPELDFQANADFDSASRYNSSYYTSKAAGHTSGGSYILPSRPSSASTSLCPTSTSNKHAGCLTETQSAAHQRSRPGFATTLKQATDYNSKVTRSVQSLNPASSGGFQPFNTRQVPSSSRPSSAVNTHRRPLSAASSSSASAIRQANGRGAKGGNSRPTSAFTSTSVVSSATANPPPRPFSAAAAAASRSYAQSPPRPNSPHGSSAPNHARPSSAIRPKAIFEPIVERQARKAYTQEARSVSPSSERSSSTALTSRQASTSQLGYYNSQVNYSGRASRQVYQESVEYSGDEYYITSGGEVESGQDTRSVFLGWLENVDWASLDTEASWRRQRCMPMSEDAMRRSKASHVGQKERSRRGRASLLEGGVGAVEPAEQSRSIRQLLTRPVKHLWQDSPQAREHQGKARWTPTVEEYREAKRPVQYLAAHLMTVPPPAEEVKLVAYAKLMMKDAKLKLDTEDKAVPRRPSSAVRRNGQVALTVLRPVSAQASSAGNEEGSLLSASVPNALTAGAMVEEAGNIRKMDDALRTVELGESRPGVKGEDTGGLGAGSPSADDAGTDNLGSEGSGSRHFNASASRRATFRSPTIIQQRRDLPDSLDTLAEESNGGLHNHDDVEEDSGLKAARTAPASSEASSEQLKPTAFEAAVAESGLLHTDIVPLQVCIGPVRARKVMSFEVPRYKEKDAAGLAGSQVAIFEHVEGAKVGEGLYPAYQLPNGKQMYVYYDGGQLVDEVHVDDARAPGKPVTIAQALQDSLPVSDLLGQLTGLKGAAAQYIPVPLLVPLPDVHTLPVKRSDLIEESAFGDLKEDNPHIVIKATPVTKIESITVTEDARRPPTSVVVEVKPWRIEDSFFAKKPRENDSKSYLDRPAVELSSFDFDWGMCCTKSRFGKMINKWSNGKVEGLKHELRERYRALLRVFDYYSCLGSGDPFSMQINGWGDLMTWTHIVDENSPHCKLADCDLVFKATNFEEDKKTEASRLNQDNALMRAEFLEAIIRMAILKFLDPRGQGYNYTQAAPGAAHSSKPHVHQESGDDNVEDEEDRAWVADMMSVQCSDLTDACKHLMDNFIFRFTVPESKIGANEFRETRLYNEEVDRVLKKHKVFLLAVFNHYRQLAEATDDMYLDIPEWNVLMHEAGLYNKYFTVRESSIAFIWSRMRFVDECSNSKSYQRSRSLTFLEFAEALGRVADMVCPPPVADLNAIGCTSNQPTAEYYQRALEQDWYLPDRDSAPLTAPKTRLLSEKIEQVLEVITVNLMRALSARDKPQLLAKLKERRGREFRLGKTGMGSRLPIYYVVRFSVNKTGTNITCCV